MAASGTCALCDGALVQEKKVIVAFGRYGAKYVRAWVCTQCGAAWPIAISAERGATDGAPLWADGRRAE